MLIHTSELGNGVRVATAARPGWASAGVALCAIGGVRAEEPAESGYAHLLEHLLFRTASARLDFESLGGYCNAFTGREHLALSGLVPAGDAVRVLHGFADALIAPNLSADAIAAERAAIERELHQSSYTTADNIEQLIAQTAWPGDRIAQAMSGQLSDSTSAAVDRAKRFYDRTVCSAATIVLAVGAVAHAEIEAAAQHLAGLPRGRPQAKQVPPRFADGTQHEFRSSNVGRAIWILPVDSDYGYAAPPLELLQHLFGSTQCSLYRFLREELRLVYGVDVRTLQYSDTGALILDVHADAKEQACVVRACEKYFARLMREGLSKAEVCFACQSLAARNLVDADRLEWQLEQLAERMMHPQREPSSDVETVNRWLRDSWPRRARLIGMV